MDNPGPKHLKTNCYIKTDKKKKKKKRCNTKNCTRAKPGYSPNLQYFITFNHNNGAVADCSCKD
jgi:hypothetical protein